MPHLGGALSGFLLSIVVLKPFEERPWKKTFKRICGFILITLVFITVIINIGFPSMYCPSEFNTNYKETFFRRVIFKKIDESSNPSESPVLKEFIEDKEFAAIWAEHNNTRKLSI